MWESLLATYALGATTDDETARVRTRITTDLEAARLAADYAAIAAMLPELLAEHEPRALAPSAALKPRVLAAARAARTPPRESGVVAAPEPVAIAPPPSSRAARTRGNVPLFLGWAVAAVLLVGCLTLFGMNAGLRQQSANTRNVVWLASRSSHAYTMKGTANAPMANAVLLESATDGKVVLLTDGFPTCANGQVYRVWMRRSNGTYVAAGTFSGANQNTETLVVPGSLRGMQEVVITAEARDQPATAPSGTTVMQGALV